ncbi:leucine-rich repeat protein, partial [Carboxylicivirga linearis]
MKKIYFLALLLLCSFIANAQYVLTIDEVEFDASTGTITKYYDTGEWNIEIPETFNGVTVTAIGKEAFVISDKKLLVIVKLPGTITTIGESAFYGNNNLQSINVTNNLTTIGASAFAYTGFRSFTIPNSVVTLGNSAFAQSNLSSLKISNSITEIGDAVFMGNNLSKVTIPSSVEKIGNGAFAANYLTSIDIPNTVTSIGSFAFQFNSLTSVSIPNSLTSIEDRVFSDNKLTSITIPSSIQSIGERAFYNNSFTEVTIPNSVSFIGVSAFGHATGNYLESIALPADVLGFNNEVWKNSIGQEVTAMTSSVWSYTVYGDAVDVHSVTFLDYDGSFIETVGVDHGSTVIPPDDPARTGYTFTGWDASLDNVTADYSVKAEYVVGHTVSFIDWDGTLLKKEAVVNGSSATAPANPVRTGYTFTGWDVAFDNITTALIVTAQYTINSYEVSFVDWDGKVLKTENVDYGSSATTPADPARTGYSFTGWDVAFDNITTALNVTAQYTINNYEVSFVDWDGEVLKTENVDYGS